MNGVEHLKKNPINIEIIWSMPTVSGGYYRNMMFGVKINKPIDNRKFSMNQCLCWIEIMCLCAAS